MLELEQIDRAILRKRVETNEEAGTITLHVDFNRPTNNNGVPINRYSASDARRWLNEAGISCGDWVSGARVRNVDPIDCGKRVTGTWVFKIPTTPDDEPQAVEPSPTFSKGVATKETVSTDTAEFEGLNYDGDTKPAPKTTSRKKTRAKKQRK